MKKYLILFFVILTCFFCAKKERPNDDLSDNYTAKDSIEYDDFDDVKEYYYQILLKKWQEQSGNPSDSVQNRGKISDDSAWNVAARALKTYYNIEHENVEGIMTLTDEYWLIRYQSLRKKEQIWILISSINGKLLSTYKDKWQIVKRSKQEILDKERQTQKQNQESSVNLNYKELQLIWKLNIMEICPSLKDMSGNSYYSELNSIHLKKKDSVYLRKLDSLNPSKFDSVNLYTLDLNYTLNFFLSRKLASRSDDINLCSFQQKLKTLYNFSDNNENIDSVTAIKIAVAAAAECYGFGMTSFKARLMGDNKEHWMVYCFPTIPNNIEQQKKCFNSRTAQYEKGNTFNSPYFNIGCPVVFMVLISRENGQVLAIDIP